jgi:hypothetical protein
MEIEVVEMNDLEDAHKRYQQREDAQRCTHGSSLLVLAVQGSTVPGIVIVMCIFGRWYGMVVCGMHTSHR